MLLGGVQILRVDRQLKETGSNANSFLKPFGIAVRGMPTKGMRNIEVRSRAWDTRHRLDTL